MERMEMSGSAKNTLESKKELELGKYKELLSTFLDLARDHANGWVRVDFDQVTNYGPVNAVLRINRENHTADKGGLPFGVQSDGLSFSDIKNLIEAGAVFSLTLESEENGTAAQMKSSTDASEIAELVKEGWVGHHISIEGK